MQYQIERNFGCRVSDAWAFRGLKTVILENDQLKVVILAGKGADIYQFVHKQTDTDFLLRTPLGVRDPKAMVTTSGSGAGPWMDVYEGGWQTVFPAGGYPSEYKGAELGLHAEASTIPWDCSIVEDKPSIVSVKFWVRTPRLPIYFEKTLTLESGTAILNINETIINEGEEQIDIVWGEHIALGSPFLNEDCVLDLPGGSILNDDDWHPNNRLKPNHKSSWPITETKAGNPVDLSKFPPKSERVNDMSYVIDMPDGWYAVTNTKKGVGFGVRFPKEVFPTLWYWQCLGGAFGYPFWGRQYNVGLEPFTSLGNPGLTYAINNGTAMKLDPSQRVNANVKAIAYTGKSGVREIDPDGNVSLK